VRRLRDQERFYDGHGLYGSEEVSGLFGGSAGVHGTLTRTPSTEDRLLATG